MIFDTHAHLDNPEFDIDRDELISQIHASGVTNIMNIGADMKTSAASLKLANDYDFIYASVGVHPSEVHGMTNENLDELIKMAENPKVKAIGEIGLDYHYENIEKSEQKEWFIRQLELAKSIDMPVIIHDRDSSGDCLKILKEQKISDGVMHCFSGSAETAKNLVDMGFMISFTGVLTFKNAKRAVMACREIPLS
ncbi:MAG: TatD family hydrolase, partial [Oscillospiraceae bacterium]